MVWDVGHFLGNPCALWAFYILIASLCGESWRTCASVFDTTDVVTLPSSVNKNLRSLLPSHEIIDSTYIMVTMAMM